MRCVGCYVKFSWVSRHTLRSTTTMHKYLGRNLNGNFLARRNSEFAHRLQVAWNKFHKYKHILLLNKHVSLVLWLKLFDAVVSPAMLFLLATLPLTRGCLQKLSVVQRRMPWAGGTFWCIWITNWRLQKLCSQWRVGKTDSSDQSFDLHIGLHAHLKDGWLNPFPGIPWRIGSWILLVNLTGSAAVHQHVGMTFWQNFSSEFFHNNYYWWHVAGEASS